MDVINLKANRKDLSFRAGQTLGPFTMYSFKDEAGNVIDTIDTAALHRPSWHAGDAPVLWWIILTLLLL